MPTQRGQFVATVEEAQFQHPHMSTRSRLARTEEAVHVLPFSAGAPMALEGSLTLTAFADAPPLAHLQGLGTGQLRDDPATVRQYELTYDLVVASALSPDASLALIESVAEDDDHEDQRLR